MKGNFGAPRLVQKREADAACSTIINLGLLLPNKESLPCFEILGCIIGVTKLA